MTSTIAWRSTSSRTSSSSSDIEEDLYLPVDDLDGVAGNAGARVGDRAAAAQLELPAVPRASEQLLVAPVAVLVRVGLEHRPAHGAVDQAGAAMGAARADRVVVALDVEARDRAAVNGDQPACAHRQLAGRADRPATPLPDAHLPPHTRAPVRTRVRHRRRHCHAPPPAAP